MNNRTTSIGLLIKLSLAFFLLFGLILKAAAQVKVGDNPTTISPSSILEAESTNKGFLKPRLTTAQRTAIASPATGLEVYDTDTQSTWYYNGTVWVNASGTNIYNADGTLAGNRTVAQGTNTLSFTGTAVNAFSVDGTTFSVDAANNAIGLGTASPNINAVIDATAVNKGILFPRVALTATNLPAPLASFVAGMTVYNTATASSGATAVSPGLYYSDGTKWVQTGDDYAPDPTVGSIAAFTFSSIPAGYLECNGAAVSRTTYAVLFAKIGTTYGAGDGSTTFNLPDLRGEFIRGWDNGRGVDASRTLGSAQAAATSLPTTAFTTNTVANHTHSVDPASTATSTAGSHTHSVDPPSTTSSTTGAHTHTVDPPATNTGSAGAHTHSLTRRSNPDNGAFDTGDGRQDESSAATTDRTNLGLFNTGSAGAHTHTINIASFNSGSTGDHSHTTDIAAFNSAANGDHSHTVDIPATTSTAAGSHNHTIAGGDAETRPRNVAMVYAIKAVDNVIVPTYATTAITAAAAANEPWYKVGTATGATSNTDDVYINGNVGIGTATPVTQLDVNGNSRFLGLAIVQGRILLRSPDGTDAGYINATEEVAADNGISIESTRGAGKIVFKTNLAGTIDERMRISNNGYVGIGTTTPVAKLHIVNDGGASAGDDVFLDAYGNTQSTLSFFRSGGTVASPTNVANGNSMGEIFFGGRINGADNRSISWIKSSYKGNGTTALSDLTFRTSGTERMIINENGNVGIGISTPSDALHVIGGGLVVGSPSTQSTASQGAHIEWNRDNTGQMHILNQRGSGSSGIRFGNLSNTNVETEWARFNENGNLGIGTTTPVARLHVVGPSTSYLNIWEGTGNPANSRVLALLDNSGSGVFKFSARNDDYSLKYDFILFDAATGNVGIGSNTPLAKLDVRGPKTGWAAGTGANSNAPSQAIIGAGVNGSAVLNDWPSTWAGGLSTYDIVGRGTYFSSYVTRSDSTLKKDIRPLTADMTNLFMKIRPVTYLMKEETPELPGLQYGFIAQEVGELFPSLVTKKTTAEGTMGMNYQGLIAPTIYVVQEQQRKLEQLQSEIAALTKENEEIDMLKKEIEELKALMQQLIQKK